MCRRTGPGGQGGQSGAERLPDFLLDIPDLWDQADLSGEELARTRARALATTDDPGRRARINDMFRQGREVTRADRRHGALLAAGTATLYADGLFMAYGMVFAVTTPAGQELTLPVLSARLGVRAATGAPPGTGSSPRSTSRTWGRRPGSPAPRSPG